MPDWDEAHHLSMGFNYYIDIQSKNWEELKKLYFDSKQIYPPLYHLLIALSFGIFGPSVSSGRLINIPFILILMLSIYGIGKVLGNKKAGLMAAILTPILPAFLTLQERPILDYANVSILMLSFYLLFKTDYFRIRKYSILFGLSILLNILIKWPFAVPGIPFAIYAIVGFIKFKSDRVDIFINTGAAFLIFLLGSNWYVANFKHIANILDFYWNPNGFAQIIYANPKGFTASNLLAYAFYAPTQAAGLGLIPLVFFYLTLFLFRKNKQSIYLILSIVITYIFLTYLNDKSELYIIYTYPSILLLICVGLAQITKRWLRYGGIAILTASIFVNFVLSQNNYRSYLTVNINNPLTYIPLFPNYNSNFRYGNWPTKIIVEKYLARERCDKGILVFPDLRLFNVSNLVFYLMLNSSANYAVPANAFYNPANDVSFSIPDLIKHRCIISKTGDPGVFANKEVLLQVNSYLNSRTDYIKNVIPISDGSDMFIYIKINDFKNQ